MRKQLFLLLYILPTSFLIAQNSEDKTIYLDSLKQETTEGNHKYYRIIKEYNSEKDLYTITDYYKSGKPQIEGTYSDKNANLKKGDFVYYFENGNKQSLIHYEKPGALGKHVEWYENGNKKLEGEYFENKKGITTHLKINQYWSPETTQTIIDGNGTLEEIDNYFFTKGNIRNGLRDSIWIGKNLKSNSTYTENYSDGELLSGTSIDSDNIKHEYTEIETKPIPKKGIDGFYKYVGKNFKVTRASEKNNIYGKLIANFVVEKDGSITNIKIIKSLGYGLDEELIRVLSNCSPWSPGKQRGIKVKVLYSIPISIQKQ